MAIFGSSDFNIVGCSGAISGMINGYTVLWTVDVVPYLAFFSAVFCTLFWAFRLDIYIFHMPSAVFAVFLEPID